MVYASWLIYFKSYIVFQETLLFGANLKNNIIIQSKHSKVTLWTWLVKVGIVNLFCSKQINKSLTASYFDCPHKVYNSVNILSAGKN